MLSLAVSMREELGEQLGFMFWIRICSFFLLEQHICTHPLVGVSCSANFMAVHFCFCQLLFTSVMRHIKWSCFQVLSCKMDIFCFKTYFRF